MEIKKVDVNGLQQSLKASGYPTRIENDPYRGLKQSDFNRANQLASAESGSGHDCFLKGINVQMDVTAPQYWWLEFGRYHFADIVSSQSKMRLITEFDLADQCNRYVDADIICHLRDLVSLYNSNEIDFQRLISNVPMGLELNARVTTNYLQLKTIYQQRKNHKLEEWQEFCNRLKELPYSKWITGEEDKE